MSPSYNCVTVPPTFVLQKAAEHPKAAVHSISCCASKNLLCFHKLPTQEKCHPRPMPPCTCACEGHTLLQVATSSTQTVQVIKPLYGFISDSVPLFGYRRRSYLVLCGLIGMSALGNPICAHLPIGSFARRAVQLHQQAWMSCCEERCAFKQNTFVRCCRLLTPCARFPLLFLCKQPAAAASLHALSTHAHGCAPRLPCCRHRCLVITGLGRRLKSRRGGNDGSCVPQHRCIGCGGRLDRGGARQGRGAGACLVPMPASLFHG